ncbi:SusC/RagA family protein [Niabella ginsenosidivorans]|uniref:SusC/RagA family protein n=1 Tax=Niabella ginsenosidivorans TaxID=1176587 RepID=A0A1A9HXY3_9BACT|nr:TonB-dependent receptor [Niabella ginsenosidivorans]ANH80288.1 SusC/RagA family protein [Niabella ginsenosidivorans]
MLRETSYTNCIKSFCLLCTFLCIALCSLSQDKGKSISGVISDKAGNAVPNATVELKNRDSTFSKRTLADEQGHFSFYRLEPGEYELRISSVSYEPLTIKNVQYNGVQPLQLSYMLDPIANQLNDIVVVGYGTQKKINLTGAVDQLSGEALEGRVQPTITQMLQGAIPNLNVNPLDGKPNREVSYNIRGMTSIGQGGSALILIDGVEGDPATLNPNDVESVTALKDAASAAVYGSKGTFGVVLITTKSAKKGKTTVTYSGSASLQKEATRPDFVTDGYEYATHFYEAYNAWNNYSSVPAKLNKTQIFTLDWLEEFKKRKEQGITDEVTVDANGNYVYYGNEDYYGALLKKSTFTQQHNLSVSGKTDKFDYYLSGRYFSSDGIYNYNPDLYKSYSMRAKQGLQVTDWLKISNNMDYSYYSYRDPITAGEGGVIWRNIADEGHPTSPIFNPDGTFSYSAAYTVGDFIYGKNVRKNAESNIRNTTSFETKFFNNSFHIKGDFTFRSQKYELTRVRVPVPYSVKEGQILYLETSTNDNIYTADQRWNYLTANLYADYEKRFAKHYVKGLLGYNYDQRVYDSKYITKNGLLSPETENINLALGNSVTATGGYNKYRTSGLFYRLNYIYAERYLFEVNGRYDGSSKFPGNEQWGFFPSVSAGWRISREHFWNVSPSFISDLKLRGSYGSLGNGNIDPYSYLEQFAISTSGRILNGAKNPQTSAPGVIPDNLTWETARTANYGLDIAFLKNRLTFTGDYYIRKTLNMYTVGQTLPDVFGASSPKGNYADLTTKGFELSLGYADFFMVANKPFNYNVKATLADNHSRIDRYNNTTGSLSDYYVGQQVGEIWGYVTQGLFQSQEEIDNAPKQPVIKSSNSGKIYPGDIRFADLDNNGVIDYGNNTIYDHGDKKIIGNKSPRYLYSFTLNLDWNNIYFSAFVQGVGKQDWYPSNESIFWGQYNRPYNNLPTWHLNNYWTEENPNGYFPRYAGYNESLKLNPQTRYLQNVSYTRLKNIQIGYSLPAAMVKRMGLQAVRIGLSGENLLTWSPLYKRTKDIDVTNIGNSDPDVSSGYGDGFNYPTMKSYSLNILLTL